MKLLIGMLFVCVGGMLFGQEKLAKDLDGDKKSDSLYFKDNRIVCALSSKKYKKTFSREIETLDGYAFKSTKSGFEFGFHAMRAGYAGQFRYDAKSGKIQLIGMSRYEFGNAANDGSGESSVNLLTGNYIGNWNYYDHTQEKLVKIPSIKTKMTFSKTYLEAFNEGILETFAEKCSTLYYTEKAKMTGRK